MASLKNDYQTPGRRYRMTMARKKQKSITGTGLELKQFEPLTDNQELAFDSNRHLVLHGLAGTGKTFISMYLGLEDVVEGISDKVVVIRSAVPTRDMGFLPGTEKDKAAVYEEPYSEIATELYGRGDAYEILKKHNIVHFMTTSFIRGVTLSDAVIIVDECQNMSFHELDSIITRLGENCRIMFCGDFRQSDLAGNNGELQNFLNILNKMQEFDTIEFGVEDIVRSQLVKSYIIAKSEIIGK